MSDSPRSRYPNLKTTSAFGKVSVFLAKLLSYSRRLASMPSLVTAIWTARVVHSLFRRTSAICTALASAQTLMACSRACNGNKRHIDMELQSALRVFNYDDFRVSKLEVSRAILGGKISLSAQTTSELHVESRSL